MGKDSFLYRFQKLQRNVIFKLCIAFIFLYCLDYVFGAAIKYFYFRQTSGPQFVTTYSIEKTEANILIFGSSRANHHYHPVVFENQLNMTCHNSGRDGFDIFYHYAVLKAILTRYTPEIVILDINRREFIDIQDSYDKLSALYYKHHPEIREIVDLKSKVEKYKMLSHVYPYNSTLSYIILGNTKYNQNRRNEISGYVPLMKKMSQPLNNYSASNEYDLDPEKIRVFNDFIEACEAYGIKLYIIHSPYYANVKNQDKSIDICKEITLKRQVPFFDFTNDTTFIDNPGLFSDASHLNNEGAELFSARIAEYILKKDF